MNIISVEHLPPLTINHAAIQNRMLQQGRNLPPLTIVSKGKAITTNGTNQRPVGKNPPSLPVVQRGKAKVPFSSKQCFPPPLSVIKESQPLDQKSGKKSVAKGKKARPLSAKGPLVLKKYEPVSALAPFFGHFKSRIPLKKTVTADQQESSSRQFENAEWIPHESLIDVDLTRSDTELPLYRSLVGADNEGTHMPNSQPNGATNVDDTTDIIIEMADKAVQTECFCCCYSRPGDNNSDIKRVLDQISKVSIELKELKSNITGRTTTKLMAGIFPIKTETDLIKIDHYIDNGENFELRLKLYLKYLKPKSSTTITTAFKELFDDSFLKGKNWDGANNTTALNKYTFFETILFDAWKNSTFTKDVYVSAMKEEIKKSHDRERKRVKQA